MKLSALIPRSYLVLALSSALSAGYSYSEPVYTYDYTKNAAQNSLTWSMDGLIPEGIVDINGVVYRYTTEKNVTDDMLVHVQNENAIDGGYIFRETDDWSGLPGGTINKVVPLNNIPLEYFGDGSIEVEGKGTVTNQTVKYSYRLQPLEAVEAVDTLDFIPEVPEYSIYNALEDENLKSEQADVTYNDEEESQEERKNKARRATEKAIGIGNTAAQQAMMLALTTAVDITSYYNTSIQGGVYTDSMELLDKELPENRRGLRNGLAQQIMHNRMVDSQYRR